jgi:hypothetical protein
MTLAVAGRSRAAAVVGRKRPDADVEHHLSSGA